MSKGLEALKRLEENIICVNVDYEMKHVADYETIEKELKALEIIKEKEVNVCSIKYYDLEEYNITFTNKLTQEEFDILKEALCDDYKRGAMR